MGHARHAGRGAGLIVAASDRYVPALGYRFLTRFYDPVVALTTREALFKARLVRQAAPKPGARVLDLACGTGTLALLTKAAHPDAEVIGVDGDPEMLAQARSKAGLVRGGVQFREARAEALPFPDAHFDLVLSSLFFHHLSAAGKVAAFREIARVLRPGGELHVADWGKPASLLMRVAFLFIRLLDGFANTRDNVEGRLPGLMQQGGLAGIHVHDEIPTVFGTMTLFRAQKPA